MATRARVILPSPPPWHALPNALHKRERYEAGADYLADPLKILIADAPEVAVAEIVSGYIVTPRLNPAGRKEPHHACALRADSVLFRNFQLFGYGPDASLTARYAAYLKLTSTDTIPILPSTF